MPQSHTGQRPSEGNRLTAAVRSRLWPILLPPTITGITAIFLLRKLGSATWMDAQTWPVEFRVLPQAVDALSGSGICRAFVFIAALLVVLNNVILYLREIKRVAEEARPGSPHGRRARSLAFWLALIATLLVCFWLVDTAFSFLPATTTKHELFALTSFSLFGIIDCLLSVNARQTAFDEKDTAKRARLEAEETYYGQQASYTDAAVVAGMIALLYAEHKLGKLPAFTDHFEWGFVTGAIGMHLAYSQFVFLALTLRHRRTLRQISLDAIAATTPDELL